MKVEVRVYPREGILDPQGKAIASALGRLGHTAVTDVRAGKVFFLEVSGEDRAWAEGEARRMAEVLSDESILQEATIHVSPGTNINQLPEAGTLTLWV